MELTARLQSVADQVPQGAAFADIGTDHAYLPVWLLLNGRIRHAIAADLREGPLNSARETAEQYGVSHQVSFRLCIGLADISADEVDTIVIAGMGGDLIADIITAAPWVKNKRYELILQPMTSVEDLRQYLCDNGFMITEERAVSSQGRIYTVIKTVFVGVMVQCDPLFFYFGKLIDDPGDDELIYIKRKRRIIMKLASDIEGVKEKEKQFKNINMALKELEGLIEKWELTDYFYTDSKKK